MILDHHDNFIWITKCHPKVEWMILIQCEESKLATWKGKFLFLTLVHKAMCRVLALQCFSSTSLSFLGSLLEVESWMDDFDPTRGIKTSNLEKQMPFFCRAANHGKLYHFFSSRVFHVLFKLPAWVTKKIDSHRWSFLWSGGGSTSNSISCKVNWKMCAYKNDEGGLGVKDINQLNNSPSC